MQQDSFEKRKKEILTKKDKSSKGSWDKKIQPLCKKINKKASYYSTSSCSGRIIIMIDQEKKEKNLFLFTSHKKMTLKEIKEAIQSCLQESKKNIKYKVEPCILHVACKSLKDAKILYDKAKDAGWKKSGLIAFKKRIILELNSTERIEFPLTKRILTDDMFLKEVINTSNKKLERCWQKISKLQAKI